MTAPARVRELSHGLRASSNLALSQWPRNRLGSWGDDVVVPVHVERLDSASTVRSEIVEDKGDEWRVSEREVRVSPHSSIGAQISTRSQQQEAVAMSSVPTRPSIDRFSLVPKTRLLGGLAEMGGISVNNTEGWPIYWK